MSWKKGVRVTNIFKGKEDKRKERIKEGGRLRNIKEVGRKEGGGRRKGKESER